MNGIPILTWMDDPSDNELLKYIPMLEFLAVVDDVRQYIPKFVHGSFINFSVVYKVIMEETQSKSDVNKPEKISINIFNENYSNYYLTPTQIETQNDTSVNYLNKSSYSLHNTPHTKLLNESRYLNSFINYTPQTTVKKTSDQLLNRFPQRDERSSTSISTNYKKEDSSYLKEQSYRDKPRTSSVAHDNNYNYHVGRDSKTDQFKPNKPIQLETQSYKINGTNYPEARPASAIGTKFPSAAILSFTDMTNDLNKFIDNKEYSKFKEEMNRNSDLNLSNNHNKMNFAYSNLGEDKYNEMRNLYSYGPSVRYDRNQSLNDLKGGSSNYQMSNSSIKDELRYDDSKFVQPSLNFSSMKQINKSYSITNQPSLDTKPSYLKSSTTDFSWGNTSTNTRSYGTNNRSYNMNEFDYSKRPKNTTNMEISSNSNRVSSSYSNYGREINAMPVKPYESTYSRFEYFNNYSNSPSSYESKSFLGANKNLLRLSDGGNINRTREFRDHDRNFRYKNNY